MPKRTFLEAYFNLSPAYCLSNLRPAKTSRYPKFIDPNLSDEDSDAEADNPVQYTHKYSDCRLLHVQRLHHRDIAYYHATGTGETVKLYLVAVDESTGNVIGHLQADTYDKEYPTDWVLSLIRVDSAYQQRGIGTHLIRLAASFANFKIAYNDIRDDEQPDNTFWLTDVGRSLIDACIAKKIIDKNKHFYVPHFEDDYTLMPTSSRHRTYGPKYGPLD